VILLCGIPSEPPLALVRERLDVLAAPYVLFNQRRFDAAALDLEVGASGPTGQVVLEGHAYPLGSLRAVYVRFMDDRLLPELDGEPEDSPRRARCRALHDGLMRWLEVMPGRVVNRLGHMGSNGSKPYQAQLIAGFGLRVPETLVTNDPAAVLAFRRRHGRVIYKSVSGVRSIVRELSDEEFARLEAVRRCPVQFQAFVPGYDVRVHTIGDEVFATRITSPDEATDYRYADHDGVMLEPITLPHELAGACVRLARGLGLEFAGIDLRVGVDGAAWCLEVNPSPAYSYYEANTGQPISAALAGHLAEASG
jgi:glutathione synthase/RimK-type ligase-like ATP-grasp enzyme